MSKHNVCQCPFYKMETKKGIVCEGDTRIHFMDVTGKRNYYAQFCCDRWQSCSVAKALCDFYERREREREQA